MSTTNEIKQLSTKYGLKPKKIKYILEKYGSMETFLEAYQNDTDDFVGTEKILKPNMKCPLVIDINERTRAIPGYTELAQELIRKLYYDGNTRSYKRNIAFCDGEEIYNALINGLDPDSSDLLIRRYGLKDGKCATLKQLGEEIGISQVAVGNRLKRKIWQLRTLRYIGKIRILYEERDKQKLNFSPEECEILDELFGKIWRSNLVCFPDKGYSQEGGISSQELQEIIDKIEELYSQIRIRPLEDADFFEVGLFDLKMYEKLERGHPRYPFNVPKPRTVLQFLRDESNAIPWGSYLSYLKNLTDEEKQEIRKKIETYAVERGIAKKTENGKWVKEFSDSGIDIDVETYLMLKSRGISTKAQVKALIKLGETREEIIHPRIIRSGELLEKLFNMLQGKEEIDHEFLRLYNMNSDEMQLLRELGPDAISEEGLRYGGDYVCRQLSKASRLVKYRYGEEFLMEQEPNEKMEISYETTVDMLGLSVRSTNILQRSGIDTVAKLMQQTKDNLNGLRNMGKKALDEILRKQAEIKELLPPKEDVTELQRLMSERLSLEVEKTGKKQELTSLRAALENDLQPDIPK